ncbi:MAG TPA: Abi family protein [Candidatus Gemmiger faecavium]|nr:Abi family protein [Candidatus Gemmiger faecavium]
MPTKPFLTLDKQVELLKSRGLIIEDDEYAKNLLASVNYYRFSAYSLTLRRNDVFNPDTKLQDIYYLYNFDARLRSFVLKYTPKVEVLLRAHMSYIHSKNHGALGYLDSSTFKDPWYHALFLSRLQKLLNDSKEAFVLHHRNDLDGQYPFWVAVEVMTFDLASKCLQNMNNQDQVEIAKYYSIHLRFLANWMHCVVIARNIAAHNGRFYNRPISTKPTIPNAVKGHFRSDRAFSYLYVIYQLLENDTDKELFIHDLKSLLSAYDRIDCSCIGLPSDWENVLTTPIHPLTVV